METFLIPIPLGAGGIEVEQRLLTVLVQLVVIIVVARVFAALFRKLGQPTVVGEILAGLILGPSVLGKLEAAGVVPHISAMVFDPAVAPVFTVLSQIGLVLLLFLIGLEFEVGHLRASGRTALGISLAGVAVPFVLGIAIGYVIHPHLHDGPTRLGFLLFMGTAMSITALPVLGRILMELKISRTRVGTIAITAAAVDDACGWILLAAVSALVQAKFRIVHSLGMIGLTAGFALTMILVVRPAMRWWIGRTLRDGRRELGLNEMAVVLVVLFLCAVATNLIGIFAIFGAFMFGTILSDQREFRESILRSFREFVTVFFLPIFFTYTGLRTDTGTLHSATMWLLAGGVLAVAIAGKFGGCATAAWLGGCSWRDSASIGIMMNTRGLMELVVINVGYDMKVIPQSVYCMLVIMAVATTVVTTPLLLATTRGTELEAGLVESGFARMRLQ
jgi:Kef-type K+ transport system membrane component KefB